MDGYILCGTPRSGSTLLCTCLRDTGRMGDPNSYFRPADRADWAVHWGLPAEAPDAAYLAALHRAGRAGTPVFGLRLMQENLAETQAMLAGSTPGRPVTGRGSRRPSGGSPMST